MSEQEDLIEKITKLEDVIAKHKKGWKEFELRKDRPKIGDSLVILHKNKASRLYINLSKSIYPTAYELILENNS
jgi:ribosomal protein L5